MFNIDVTIQVPLVEQEMITLPEYTRDIQCGSCYSIFSCMCNVL